MLATQAVETPVVMASACVALVHRMPGHTPDVHGSIKKVGNASALQRYKQLLFFATKLEKLPAEEHIEENKVKGCVSQVGRL